MGATLRRWVRMLRRMIAPELELVPCPQCGQTAEVTDRAMWASTDGPIEHVTLRCVGRHVIVCPTETLEGPATP